MPANATASNADREIVLSRTFDAPRELVFKVWTDPAHVPHWWGPRGFTTTTHKMEVKPGGVWRYVMHGPDGTNYENIITYVEVVPPERLVYKHGGDVDTEPVNFLTTVTFEERSGKTTATMRSVFPSAQARDHVVKNYGAIEGGKQHLERLGEYLATMSNAEKPSARTTPSATDPFVITRVFKAPRDMVWKAWTERDRLIQWFGPKGLPMTKATLDLRPGGTFHYCLTSAQGQQMWGKFTYREISPQDRIVLVSSFSDEKGGIARHPMSPTWPREMLSTTTFADHAGIGRGTVITIKWAPLNASAEELATFNAARAGMIQGWTGTFEQLDEYLAKA